MNREILFREEITYTIDDWLITTNLTILRADSKGWYKENGYIMRKVNNHPKQNKRGYVAEHRLVYERYLGRFLDSKEVIHHINGNREDNRIENLQISIENGEHIKEHHKKGRNSNGQFIIEEPIFNEIKFRLFDKDRKLTLIYTLNKLISTTFGRSKFEFRGRFTGLKDKNGVEIYEGDICIGNGHIEKDDEQFIIKYGKYKTEEWEEAYSCNTYQFGWYAEFINSKSQVHLVTPNGIEVIGNIHDKEVKND